MSDIIMNGENDDKRPYVLLDHVKADGTKCEQERLVFDELDKKTPWLANVVLLPWAAPHRLLGFVHSRAEPGKESFVLHAAFSYVAQMAVQQVAETKLRAVPGPRIALPYDLISMVDVEVHQCPTVIWAKKQGPDFREFLTQLLRQQIFPPMGIEVASPADMPPAPKAKA